MNWERLGGLAGVLALIYTLIQGWNELGVLGVILLLLFLIIIAIVERKSITEAFLTIRKNSTSLLERLQEYLLVFDDRFRVPILLIFFSLNLFLVLQDLFQFQLSDSLTTLTLFDISIKIGWGLFSFSVVLYFLILAPRRERNLLASQAIYGLNRLLPTMPALNIVFRDNRIQSSWVNPDLATEHFVERGFSVHDADSLEQSLVGSLNAGTAHEAILVFCQDVVPATITQTRNRTSLLGQFLNAGGRVVWWGDVPLHFRGIPNGGIQDWLGGPPVLGINHYDPVQAAQPGVLHNVLWDRDDLNGLISLTDAGNDIGLRTLGTCKRPAIVDEDTIVYSELQGDLGFGPNFEGARFAISWRKVYNPQFAYSGFMQFPLMPGISEDLDTVGDFYNFATLNMPFGFLR